MSNWPVTRLKFHATIIAGQSPDSETVIDRGSLPFIQGCAEFGSVSPLPLKYCDSAPKRAPVDSTLLSVRAPVGTLNVADQEIGIGRGVAAIVARSTMVPRFTVWLLHALGSRLQEWATGSTFEAVTATDVGNLPFALPSISGQTRIANFLDEKTARIDALIAEKERLADILKHLRAETIDNVVLGREIETRDKSLKGLDILGSIPSDWQASRLKYELDFVTSGSRGWADHYADEGALFIRIGNLTRDSLTLDLGDIQRVSLPSIAEGVRARVLPGDLIISITAYLGSVAVVPEGIEEAYVSQHVSLARPNCARALPKWLGYVVLSRIGKTFFDLQAYGGTKIQLSLDDVRELPVPLPAIDEQKYRVAKLENRLQEFVDLMKHVERHVILLREYRSSLISAAVTGQLNLDSFRSGL